MKSENNEQQGTFETMGISPKILGILNYLKLTKPTPIQSKAIPMGIKGKDIVGIAQTGTGKTLAYSIPLIQQIMTLRNGKQALIIVPTRELALQVDETFQKVGGGIGIKKSVIIGGVPFFKQTNSLKIRPDVIIATPGRLIDHARRKTINFSNIGYLVLDEADRMFDMGFAPQIRQILSFLREEKQTMLFSATMPEDIEMIATRSMKHPLRIEIARSGTVAEKIEQELFLIPKEKKGILLEKILNGYKGTVLIFSRTKFGAKKICRSINIMGHNAAEIHSNRSLAQRQAALAGFKTGKHRVLVATDIASRGIDVAGIELIINYDMPENPEDYIHRIGRTGRAGQKGHAISFATPDQRHKIFKIEKLTRSRMNIINKPV